MNVVFLRFKVTAVFLEYIQKQIFFHFPLMNQSVQNIIVSLKCYRIQHANILSFSFLYQAEYVERHMKIIHTDLISYTLHKIMCFMTVILFTFNLYPL